ncbi:MAG TPA: magnesium/cobalt transporter CorA [Actinomycetota bacterium]|nr:magnesium/cobalt transporter CorA [Actinomycetota bacterium]
MYVDGRLEEADFDPVQIDEVLKRPTSLVWLDIAEPTEEKLALLAEEFGFHELAIEDSLHPHQRPKIEQYESYFLVVAYGMSIQGGTLVEHELAVFVGRNYLVTVRKSPPYDFDPVVKRWEANSVLTAEGGGYLLYVLLDEIVDGYFSALDHYEDRSEVLEDAVFGDDSRDDLQSELFSLKKDLVRFRRMISPLREVLDVMQRRTVGVVTPTLEPYYRDVYDHVLRATDFVDSLRDILTSVLEASLAVISNRLNEVMKSLTSWAAIILVPTLIAGIYGMNFRHMPELKWYYGYPFALGLMALAAAILYRAFKKRGWL